MFFISHLYFDHVKRPSSGWMAVTSITHQKRMNKFENLHVPQRKINTPVLLLDARPSHPILAVKEITYIQALRLNTCRNEDIYELQGVHIANFEVDLCSSSVEYCSISNVNSLYQCSCKQCCPIAVYAMCYSVINPCGYWTSGTLSALASNGNTLYHVLGVKRNIMPVDLPKTECQWRWDKPYCLCCKQWCPMLQFGWEQICVEDVHFKTWSWSDRIFVVNWNVLYKLCSSAKK